MSKSDLFDEEDLQAVDSEMARIVEREKNSLRAKMEARLRILTKFRQTPQHGENTTHPSTSTLCKNKCRCRVWPKTRTKKDF